MKQLLMSKITQCRRTSILIASLLFIAMTTTLSGQTREKIELIYGNVWGSLYNPEPEQCDETPTITADGSVIDTLNASKQRWLAVSQDLLYSPLRHHLFAKDTADHRYEGRLKFGDTIWVESPNPNINGKWVVHDLMNKKHKNAIDFLQTTGDGSLYNNNKLWNGKFKDISIYKINKDVNDGAPKVKTHDLWMFRPSLTVTAIMKIFPIEKNPITVDDLIRNHDKCVDRYWDRYYMVEEMKCEKMEKHQIDSMKIEMNKYYDEDKIYHKMIKKFEKRNK